MASDRELVFEALDQAFNAFVFNERKLDKDLPWAKLQRLVRDGVVSKDEIVHHFKELIDEWDITDRSR